QPDRAALRPRIQTGRRARRRPVREHPVPVPSARRVGPATLRRLDTMGADRAGAVPQDRETAVPADHGRARLLLVPAHPAGGQGDMTTLDRLLSAWLPEQRWFSAKGRQVAGVAPTPVPAPRAPAP